MLFNRIKLEPNRNKKHEDESDMSNIYSLHDSIFKQKELFRHLGRLISRWLEIHQRLGRPTYGNT